MSWARPTFESTRNYWRTWIADEHPSIIRIRLCFGVGVDQLMAPTVNRKAESEIQDRHLALISPAKKTERTAVHSPVHQAKVFGSWNVIFPAVVGTFAMLM